MRPILVALVSLFFFAGCEPQAPSADVPAPLQHVAEVHRARCGNCHVRVEPGTRSHEALASALSRHRTRVHISEDEWGQLLEYLAPGSPSAMGPVSSSQGFGRAQ